MQHQPIIIQAVTMSIFPAWRAAIRLQAGALGLVVALRSPKFTPDHLLVQMLASLAKAVLDSIPTEAQSEAIQGKNDLLLYPLLRTIHVKFNRTSPADHKALDWKTSRTMLVNFDTLEDYFAEHRIFRSQMLDPSFPSVALERPTINFIIRGLANHPDFQYVLTNWASEPSETIQDLFSMVISAQSMAHYIYSAIPILIILTHEDNTIRSHHQYNPTPPMCA